MDLCDGPLVSGLVMTSPRLGGFDSDLVSSTPKRLPHPPKISSAEASEAAGSVWNWSCGDLRQQDPNDNKQNLSLLSTHTNFQGDRTHCPSTSLVPSRARHWSECQSEGEASRKTISRSYHCQQSVQQDKDGHIVSTTRIEESHNIPKEMWGKGLTQTLNATFPPVPPSSQPALTDPQAAADTSHYVPPNRQLTDVSESTIKLVADGLGREGTKVMMDLITLNDLEKIEERFPKDVYRRHYQCLVQWLQIQGSTPCLDQLKGVLRENGRRDLVEAVEQNEAKIIETKRKAIEAKEKGYATSP